jgi:hypothetical protein
VTFLRAAETVLKDAEEPLTAREITQIALSRRLIQTRGKTPVNTMRLALYGAPEDSPIRREFTPGPRGRAIGPVRWYCL